MVEEKKSRKPVIMEKWVRARITETHRTMLDELIEDYQVDESELIRRLITHIYKKRPTLGGEAIVPVGKSAARLSVTA